MLGRKSNCLHGTLVYQIFEFELRSNFILAIWYATQCLTLLVMFILYDFIFRVQYQSSVQLKLAIFMPVKHAMILRLSLKMNPVLQQGRPVLFEVDMCYMCYISLTFQILTYIHAHTNNTKHTNPHLHTCTYKQH